jgi:hypothetical protein
LHLTKTAESTGKPIVDLRDAIAHGRVWHDGAATRLLKFSRPTKNNGAFTATVTFCETLTPEWFRRQLEAVALEVFKVRKFTSAKLRNIA